MKCQLGHGTRVTCNDLKRERSELSALGRPVILVCCNQPEKLKISIIEALDDLNF